MCLSQTHIPWAAPLVRDSEDAKTFTIALGAMACKPSWTMRGLFKPTPGRPGLPRRFHTKINLNEYWDVLEEVVQVEVSFPTRPEHHDNEVNDNLANERAEMEVDQPVLEEAMEVEKVTPQSKDTPPSAPTAPSAPAAPAVSPAQSRERGRCSPAQCVPCGPQPPRRAPLGTINGLQSRSHLRKNLSPLSAFADNLARRLARKN